MIARSATRSGGRVEATFFNTKVSALVGRDAGRELVHVIRAPPDEPKLLQLAFFQAEDGIRDIGVTGVQTCALPISTASRTSTPWRSSRSSTRSCTGAS